MAFGQTVLNTHHIPGALPQATVINGLRPKLSFRFLWGLPDASTVNAYASTKQWHTPVNTRSSVEGYSATKRRASRTADVPARSAIRTAVAASRAIPLRNRGLPTERQPAGHLGREPKLAERRA